ncbi:MAG: sigma-70 family RNA polymerase sigma factor [Chloroflexi bacterium]|nr:sigma-70 family RNA polymerase sigma factor [Chloroflexota bacterium]
MADSLTNEAELIERSQRSDLAAFNTLVEAYQGQVFHFTLRMLSRPEAAEDATQESFFNAYRNIRSFRGGNFRVWLLRIASNVCHDYYRSKGRQKAESLDALLDDPARQPNLPSPAATPEEQALRQEMASAIATGLARLPEEQRLAVVLVDVQGFSYEEAAEVMNTALGTVKSRINRGRAALRDYLLSLGELLPQAFRLEKGKAEQP